MTKRAADHAALLAGIEAQRIISLKEASRLAGVSIDTLQALSKSNRESRAEASRHKTGRRAQPWSIRLSRRV
jgi:hypothetical protein